jgi:isoquinoline 1-oxidoreductase beta subunit
MNKKITRREFLKVSLSGAGLALAVSLSPGSIRILSAAEAEKASPLFSPDVWLEVTPENIVHIIVAKSEMGQGVYTSLPMIIADELDADWKQVRLKIAPAADRYKDPVWGTQATGGSTSIRHMFEPLQKAGATAREMLVKAASETWGVPQDECESSMGVVRHTKSSKSLTFGQLSQKAASLPVPQKPALKKESQYRFIGTAVPRLDVPDKTNGKALFGIDSFVPEMLYAAISRPPSFGAKALSYDREKALKEKGVTHIIPLRSGIAACASSPDAAWKGRTGLKVKWDSGSSPDLSDDALSKIFISHLEKEGISARNDGDAKDALKRSAKKIESTYMLPYLAHATMEPMNCTAHVTADTCEVWVPTQNQSGVLALAQKVTGLKPEKIHVHTTYLGGGFGRRFETDFVEEALLLSKETGKPVKLLWTREEDMQHDFYRPANISRITGGLDDKGNLIAWSHKIICPSIFSRVFPEQVKGGIDPAAVEGLTDLAYEVPHVMVEYVRMDNPVPVGFWRSVGSSHNAFTVESFIDEIAVAAKKDPLEFRLGLLKNNRRAYGVLKAAADKAGWGRPLADGHGRGIAHCFSFGTYVAHVAEVSVNKKDGTIKVHRMVSAVDCGNVINPSIVIAQIESAIIMGLSAALKEKVSLSHGGVESANFHNYGLLRMSETPQIEVHIVKSSDKHGGIGEPGVPPVAPAVANAVCNAVGIRLRNLPMTPSSVREALKKA